MRVFVTGGAGFIGSRFVRKLEASDIDAILVYDNLHPQVHGENAAPPAFGPKVQFVKGDIADAGRLKQAILDFEPTAVAHLVSETGTGQSYDEVGRYVAANVSGTAYLLEGIRMLKRELNWFLLTSSRAVYGEGAYIDLAGTHVKRTVRKRDDLEAGRFEVFGRNGDVLTPVASSSLIEPNPGSVYASTKLMQEYLVENVLGNTQTRLLIYRFQNVFGAGQSLINPYTGVLSIFLSRLFKGQPIAIFEDGEISRDFVYVDDVVAAMMAGVIQNIYPERPLDIGSGIPTRIFDAAMGLAKLSGYDDYALPVSGEFRPGDIRYAVADISYSTSVLGWKPDVPFEEGLQRLYDWAKTRAEFNT